MNNKRLLNSKSLEKELVSQALKGERWAQEKLYENFSKKMFIVCSRYSADRTEAEELLQTGFIKVFTNLKKYSGTGSLEGWVRTVIVRNALDYLKKKTKIKEVNLEMLDADILLTEDEATSYEKISHDSILVEIQKLPAKERMIFNMFHLDEMTHKEIGEELSILESTSRSILRRAKATLKERLENIK